MASGTSSPWYQAVWKHVEILAVSLKATPNAESSLLERFQVNGWIGTTSTAQVDELVTLALSRIESDVKEYDVFMKMLNSIPGMDVATGKITEQSAASLQAAFATVTTPLPGDKTLSPDDAINVLEELIEAQHRSYEIGLGLNVQPYILDAIRIEHSSLKDQLYFIIMEILQKTDPKPTWRAIVDVLRTPVVKLCRLAHVLEVIYCPDYPLDEIPLPDLTKTADNEAKLSEGNLDNICKEIREAQTQSRYLGLSLGVPGPVVEEIHSEYPKLRDRLRQVILAFLRQEKPRPTWSAIIDALNSQAVNLRRLAHDVEAAHPMSTRLISVSSSPGTIASDAADDPEIPRVFDLAAKRGLAILVTCDYEGTTGVSSLSATNRDADEMKTTFEQFNYDIHQLKNGEATKCAVTTLLKQVSEYLGRYSGDITNKDGERKVIIFAFSGHGTSCGTSRDQIQANDGELLNLMEEVRLPLVKTAHKIPKLFFIDACRGSDHLREKGYMGVETNFRVDFATIPDHKAYTGAYESRWMPVLARELRKRDDTFSNIVDRVNEIVHKQDEHLQQPESVSRLNVGLLKLYYKE